MNHSLNCRMCPKSYTRKSDLNRHVAKEHPPQASSSTNTTTTPINMDIEATPLDYNCPKSFFDLLDELDSEELQPISSNNSSLNKGTQINKKPSKIRKTAHIGTNTDYNRFVDKVTQTDPLIILEPTTIEKLTNGFKLISFNDIPQIFLSTAQSVIKPIVDKFQPKYTPTPISSTKRTEHESVKINKVIKETIEKTKTQTRDQLANLKVTKPVTKPNLDKLVKRYFPRLKDQLLTKPKFAHIKSPTKEEWLEQIKTDDSDNDTITVSTSESDDEPDEDTHTKASIIDEDFRNKLPDLFGDISD